MKSTLFIAALFAATTASAQSSLLLPNNSAGTAMDTPPVLPAEAKPLDPIAPRSEAPRTGAARDNAEQLAGERDADAADRNRDERRNGSEPRLREAPAPLK